MAETKIYTPSGFQALQDELDYLVTVKVEENKKDISTARSFGDLSENSEYDAAKEEQGKIHARIQELREMIANAKVVDEDAIDTSVVGIGSTVKIERDGVVAEYSIVGSNEADPAAFKISDQSPIGKKLIGTRAGVTVTVEVPAGKVTLKVLEVSR